MFILAQRSYAISSTDSIIRQEVLKCLHHYRCMVDSLVYEMYPQVAFNSLAYSDLNSSMNALINHCIVKSE